jgi:hypothetical protein
MRATTVRFGIDLWRMLEVEADRTGVSIAQYVRESALARVAYSAAARGEPSPWARESGDPDEDPTSREVNRAKLDIDEARELMEQARAVREQGLQALRKAEQIESTYGRPRKPSRPQG